MPKISKVTRDIQGSTHYAVAYCLPSEAESIEDRLSSYYKEQTAACFNINTIDIDVGESLIDSLKKLKEDGKHPKGEMLKILQNMRLVADSEVFDDNAGYYRQQVTRLGESLLAGQQ